MNRAVWGVVLAAAVAACGGAQTGDDLALRDAQAQELSAPAGLQLRLLGVNAGALSNVALTVKSVSLDVGGHAVAFTPFTYTGGMNLALANQAWLLGTFTAPQGVRMVHAVIGIDADGWMVNEGHRIAVDARCFWIELDLPVAQLILRNHAVVQLDLMRSIYVDADGSVRLVPQLKTVF